MRASIYSRISRDREGAGLGVAAQEADCRKLAESLEASIVTPHTDNDLSAYSGKPRPGYRALLEEIRAGKIDAVLVWHTDRLHRSPAELEDYIAACQPHGVTTHTVKAGNLDLTTAAGLMMARTLGNMARYEVDHAIERMQRAKRRSAESGTWLGGRRPFGYGVQVGEHPDGRPIWDMAQLCEPEAAVIREAADQLLAGASLRSVARAWNDAGVTTTTGKPWSFTGPRRVLLRARNAGLMEHRGEIVGQANWPAILEPEKWRSVVRLLEDPTRRTNGTISVYRHLGSGIYQCGVCGGGLVSNQRDGVPVYRCRELHVTRNRSDLDDFVRAVIAERLRRPDAADLLRPPVPDVDTKGLERRAVELRQRLDDLASMFAAGEVDAQQLSSGTKRINTDLEAVREKLESAYVGSVFADLGGLPDPGQAWLDASLDQQRAVLDALVVITVKPSPLGRPTGWQPGNSYFRPEHVHVEWKVD